MNLKEIKDLIEIISDKGFAEFEIERQGFRLRISRFKESQPQVSQAGPASVNLGVAENVSPGAQRGFIEGKASPMRSDAAPFPRPVEADAAKPEDELHIIRSPIVGTFYRSSSPTSETFVKIGDHVEPDTVVCIIEAMKLMNEIQAEVSGEVLKILVENGQPVEYGQSLFGIKID